MKLSVALATFNEEKKLSDCLNSVEKIADEIVVVDGGSKDNTVEVAKKFGAKVIVTKNPPIFHINKQKAIDQCQGDWILQLDADEIVSPELRNEILSLTKLPLTETKDAYFIPRKNHFLGKWLKKGGQYPDPVIRFFKKGKAYLPCKSVHEQMEVKGETGWLRGHLLHYPYLSFSEYLTKSNRYSSLSALEMVKTGQKPTFFGYFKAEIQALKTFLNLYLWHKGFLDGFPGFVFALFSGLHHISAYVKFWEMRKTNNLQVERDWV